MIDGLYLITPKMYEIYDTELNKSQNLPLKIKTSSNNSTYLWHLKLSHINLKMIDRLVKEYPFLSLTIQLLSACTSCLDEKITKRSFSAKDNKSKGILKLIHTNVCVPLNVRARGDFKYFITFIDDYSRYDYVYLLQRKFESFKKFKEFLG